MTFLSMTEYPILSIDYRPGCVGEFASASAVAAGSGSIIRTHREIPRISVFLALFYCEGGGILVLGSGSHITAMEITP